MPEFPDRECEIFELAHRMGSGLRKHQGTFPHAIGGMLLGARYFAMQAYTAGQLAAGQLRLATVAKEKALDHLIDVMKQCLKRSEADVSAHPEKLALIGWGRPRATANSISPPGAPADLTVTDQDDHILRLNWKKPADGGPVRNYTVYRRQQEGSGRFGDWRMIGCIYGTDIDLNRQPRGVRIEYHVIAANTAGESSPSNTVSVVL